MIRRGEPWGEPIGGDGDATTAAVPVAGGDTDLATASAAHPGALLRFVPDRTSDLARALGLAGPPRGSTAVACDVLLLSDGSLAVNAVVLGIGPDRLRPWHRRRPVEVEVDGRPVGDGQATTVVIANGQFLRGLDVAPRGHPGDGRFEVQVYDLDPRERTPMRRRLPQGAHVPHPRIAQRSGRRVTVRWRGRARVAVEVDGRAHGRAWELGVEVVPGALKVLV